MKKCLFVYNKGSNLLYFQDIIRLCNNISSVNLEKFTDPNFIIDNDTVILYQTWPDDRIWQNGGGDIPMKNPIYDETKFSKLNGRNHRKFPKDLIEKGDIKFLSLSNKYKILVDLHDSSNIDGFSRFSYNNYPFKRTKIKDLLLKIKTKDPDYFLKIPRIKNAPSVAYKQKFNVIFSSTHGLTPGARLQHFKDEQILKKRNNIIHYFCSHSNNEVRPQIFEILQNLQSKINGINLDKLDTYPNSLSSILTEVNPPGCGEGCWRHSDTMNHGALLLAYDDIRDIEIIPDNFLIDNEDCIYYNLDNLEEKIQYVLENPDKISQIRLNGHKKFVKSFDLKNRANILIEKINNI
jgi:hypothetical protein